MSEIKEILEDIKGIYYFKPLLDYITSLEQQVQDLKADYGSKSQVERDLLKQENERLKDCYRNNYFKYRNKVYDGRIILKQREDYKSRNNKAIDYIKEEIIPFGNEWHWDNASIEDYVKDLLNILQGSDKE